MGRPNDIVIQAHGNEGAVLRALVLIVDEGELDGSVSKAYDITQVSANTIRFEGESSRADFVTYAQTIVNDFPYVIFEITDFAPGYDFQDMKRTYVFADGTTIVQRPEWPKPPDRIFESIMLAGKYRTEVLDQQESEDKEARRQQYEVLRREFEGN